MSGDVQSGIVYCIEKRREWKDGIFVAHVAVRVLTSGASDIIAQVIQNQEQVPTVVTVVAPTTYGGNDDKITLITTFMTVLNSKCGRRVYM